MKEKFILAGVLSAAVCCLADVHPGLKSAIDAGEIKKAEVLVKKMNVTDIYCPATLSWADAKKVYGNYFLDNPQAMASICDEAFVKNYRKSACTSKSEIPLCLEALNATPVGEWQEYLDRIEKNKLQNGTEEYEAPEMVKEKMTASEKSGCMGGVKASRAFLSQYERELKMEQRKNGNVLTGLFVSILQHSIDSLKLDISKKEKNCKAGVKEVEKMVKKTRPKNYFLPALHDLNRYLTNAASSPFGFGANEQKLYAVYRKLAGKSSEFPDEKYMMDKLTRMYSKNGDVEDGHLLYSCRLYPGIDKKYMKTVGYDLFKCKDVLDKYSDVCDESKSGTVKEIATTLSGKDTVAFNCDGKKWVAMSALEKEFGICDESMTFKKHKFNGERYGCDGKEWIRLNYVDYSTYGKRCDEKKEGTKIYNKSKTSVFTCTGGVWEIAMIDINRNEVPSAQIGDVVWNTQNVDVPMKGAFCPVNDEKMCAKYSRLYYYEAAKNACADGWKLPSQADLDDLADIFNGEIGNGGKIFRKYPGAFRDENGSDRELTYVQIFWLEDVDGTRAAGRVEQGETVGNYEVGGDGFGFPVRCVLSK